jgi:hypothetical protein
MRRVVRHILAVFLAFALVASAAAWPQCMAVQLAGTAAASHAHSAHRTDVQTAGLHDHSHHNLQHQQDEDSTATPAAPDADGHGCMKSCAMCTATTAAVSVMTADVIFTVTAHVFFPLSRAATAVTVAVDPGIPKPIV